MKNSKLYFLNNGTKLCVEFEYPQESAYTLFKNKGILFEGNVLNYDWYYVEINGGLDEVFDPSMSDRDNDICKEVLLLTQNDLINWNIRDADTYTRSLFIMFSDSTDTGTFSINGADYDVSICESRCTISINHKGSEHVIRTPKALSILREAKESSRRRRERMITNFVQHAKTVTVKE